MTRKRNMSQTVDWGKKKEITFSIFNQWPASSTDWRAGHRPGRVVQLSATLADLPQYVTVRPDHNVQSRYQGQFDLTTGRFDLQLVKRWTKRPSYLLLTCKSHDVCITSKSRDSVPTSQPAVTNLAHPPVTEVGRRHIITQVVALDRVTCAPATILIFCSMSTVKVVAQSTCCPDHGNSRPVTCQAVCPRVDQVEDRTRGWTHAGTGLTTMNVCGTIHGVTETLYNITGTMTIQNISGALQDVISELHNNNLNLLHNICTSGTLRHTSATLQAVNETLQHGYETLQNINVIIRRGCVTFQAASRKVHSMKGTLQHIVDEETLHNTYGTLQHVNETLHTPADGQIINASNNSTSATEVVSMSSSVDPSSLGQNKSSSNNSDDDDDEEDDDDDDEEEDEINLLQDKWKRKCARNFLTIWHVCFMILTISLLIVGIILRVYFSPMVIYSVRSSTNYLLYKQFVQISHVPDKLQFSEITDKLGATLISQMCIYICCVMVYMTYVLHRMPFTLPMVVIVSSIVVLVEVNTININMHPVSATNEKAKQQLKESILESYGVNSEHPFAITYDMIAIWGKCCGVVDQYDFQTVTMKYTNPKTGEVKSFQVPPTCCKKAIFEQGRSAVMDCATKAEDINEIGCYVMIYEWLRFYCNIFSIVVLLQLIDIGIHIVLYKRHLQILDSMPLGDVDQPRVNSS